MKSEHLELENTHKNLNPIYFFIGPWYLPFAFHSERKTKLTGFPLVSSQPFLHRSSQQGHFTGSLKREVGEHFLLLAVANQSSSVICNCALDFKVCKCVFLTWDNYFGLILQANKFWQQMNRE